MDTVFMYHIVQILRSQANFDSTAIYGCLLAVAQISRYTSVSAVMIWAITSASVSTGRKRHQYKENQKKPPKVMTGLETENQKCQCQPSINMMKTRKERNKGIEKKPLMCTDLSKRDDKPCLKTEKQNVSHQLQAELMENRKEENIGVEKKPMLCTEPAATVLDSQSDLLNTSIMMCTDLSKRDDKPCLKTENQNGSPQPQAELMEIRNEENKGIEKKPLMCTEPPQSDDKPCLKTEKQNCSPQPQAKAMEMSSEEIYESINRKSVICCLDRDDTDIPRNSEVKCYRSNTYIEAEKSEFKCISRYQNCLFTDSSITDIESQDIGTPECFPSDIDYLMYETAYKKTSSVQQLQEFEHLKVVSNKSTAACPASDKDIKNDSKESINQRYSDQDKNSKPNCPAKNVCNILILELENTKSSASSSTELNMNHTETNPGKKVEDSNTRNTTHTDKCSSLGGHETQRIRRMTRKKFLSGFCKSDWLSWLLLFSLCSFVNLVCSDSSNCTRTIKGIIQGSDLFLYPKLSGCPRNGVTKWEGGPENKQLTSNKGRLPNVDERFEPVKLNGTYGLRIRNFTAEDYSSEYYYWLKFKKTEVYLPDLGIEPSNESIRIAWNVTANKVFIDVSVMELFSWPVIQLIFSVNNMTIEVNGSFSKNGSLYYGTFVYTYPLDKRICNDSLKVVYNFPEFPGVNGTLLDESNIMAEDCTENSASLKYLLFLLLGLYPIPFLIVYGLHKKKLCCFKKSTENSASLKYLRILLALLYPVPFLIIYGLEKKKLCLFKDKQKSGEILLSMFPPTNPDTDKL